MPKFKGEFEIFVYIEQNEIFIYPYIKLPFEQEKFKEYFDLFSPYGFVVPIVHQSQFFKKQKLHLSTIYKKLLCY